jgi:acetoacetyl-CoA synthetase
MIAARWPSRQCPAPSGFRQPGTNYATQVLRHAQSGGVAIRHQSEAGDMVDMSWADLDEKVTTLAAALERLGIVAGDRVVGYLPNTPDTIVAFLACASIGAVWSLCAPDMGAPTVLERFRQIAPKAIFTRTHYDFGGKSRDRSAEVSALLAGLPSLESWITLDAATGVTRPGTVTRHDWGDLLAGSERVRPRPLPFDHPLWVVYSSGTTGSPKAIVHGHGGVVLEHLKLVGLHCDVTPVDTFSWYSSTGWIMWNVHIGGLLTGATIAIAEGSPGFPDNGRLWRFIETAGVTVFGAGAAWYSACMKAGIHPKGEADLTNLKMLGSTGSPLPPEAYEWLRQTVRDDIWIAPIAGGTDLAGVFLAGSPTLPVHVGEMQCRALGAAVYAFDHDGQVVTDDVGELVCTRPMPSMPLYLWGDADGTRLHESYFDTFPGIWRQGDWVRITARGSGIIYGRSDATINRYGIRMGTADIYRVVEDRDDVLDSLVVDLEYLGKPSCMILFVKLGPGIGPGRAPESHHRAGPENPCFTASRARPDRGSPRYSLHADRQEAGSADQEAAAWKIHAGGRDARRDGEPRLPCLVRRVFRGASGALIATRLVIMNQPRHLATYVAYDRSKPAQACNA